MLPDLKPQKILNRSKCLCIAGRDANAPAALGLRKLILDLRFQSPHDGNSGRSLIVYEHRRIEISISEHLNNMRKMHPDLVARLCVLRIVGLDFDSAAVAELAKVMRRF